MRHFGDCVVDVADWDGAHGDQPVGGYGTVLLGQPVVVSPHHRLVRLVVANVTPPSRARALEQHFGIDSVLVLLLETLLGRSGSRRLVVTLAEGRPAVVGGSDSFAGIKIERHLGRELAFNHPTVAAKVSLDDTRSALAVLLGHPVTPMFSVDLEMGIGRNQSVFASHKIEPP